jgi:ATP-dependent DNA helicase RecG
LNLELRRGCDDRAVIGGLDGFLGKWTSGVFRSGGKALAGRFRKLGLTASRYRTRSAGERRAWVQTVLEYLGELEKSPVEAASTAEKPLPLAAENSSAKTSSAKKTRPRLRYLAVEASLESPVTALNGVSTALAAKFKKLGVANIRDLLYFFPTRHLDYSQRSYIAELQPGMEETILATVWQAQLVRPGGRPSTEAIVGDETGNIRIIWFNNPYLVKKFKTGDRIFVSGRVSVFGGRTQFDSPQWEAAAEGEMVHTGRLVPVYPLTQGLKPRQVRQLLSDVVSQWAVKVAEFLPETLRARCRLLDLSTAINQAHYPDDVDLKNRARWRLAFDELFLLQLGVVERKRQWQEGEPGSAIVMPAGLQRKFLESLPFELTAPQQRALAEIMTDIATTRPMSRLLQGDVGSGKTVVAVTALLAAAASGFQGAIMAPTELLAEQHFQTVTDILSRFGEARAESAGEFVIDGLLKKPLSVALLTGSVTAARRRKLLARIQAGDIDIIIGTHALIQKGVEFAALRLAVVDEQHRFGVEQRAILRQKGVNPHVLVMTATPIPRTLSLTLYGDLDLSVIGELPPGRRPVKTRWFKPEEIDKAFAFLRREVKAGGHQAFIICPLVEESEAIQARAAVAEYEYLSEKVFNDLEMGLLHGRMSAREKDRVMRRFRAGEIHILVSTAVVEVGIDVPNATVMMVQSADRFGLSQLHQFRGRVGRGSAQSYCMLLAENPSDLGRRRLDIIAKTQNGFVLAEEDLKLRGPGEFFGTRQSGLPDLRMARLSDVPLLEMARREAIRISGEDPGLKLTEHRLMAAEVARLWQSEGDSSERS